MNRWALFAFGGFAIVAAWSPAAAQENVALSGTFGATGELSGVSTTGLGTLTVGAGQNINTSNNAAGAINADAADRATVTFTGDSTVTGAAGTVGSTLASINAGANASTVTFGGAVFATTFSVSGSGTVIFNGGFTSNTGSTVNFANDGFIQLGSGQTLTGAVTTATAKTGTLTLFGNSTVVGAIGGASGIKNLIVSGGNASVTGAVNTGTATLGANTLNVTGGLTLPVAGVINTTISSDSVNGKIVPTGFATIGNALQINVKVTGVLTNGTSFTIVDATSGSTGSTVTATDNSARYTFSAPASVAGKVTITTTSIPLATVVAPVVDPSSPGAVIASIVDSLPASNPIKAAVGQIATAAELADALASLGPSANFAAPLASFQATSQLQDAWVSHLQGIQKCEVRRRVDARRRTKDPGAAGAASSSFCPPDTEDSRWWLTGVGVRDEQDRIRGFEGYDSRTFGAILGYGVPLTPDIRAGFVLRYADSAAETKTSDSRANVKSFQEMFYIGYVPGQWFASAAIVFGADRYTSDRRVVLPGFDGTADGKYSGYQGTGSVSAGYNFFYNNDATTITPSVSLQYTRLHTDGYTETGNSNITLRVQSQNYDFLRSGVGVEAAHDVALSDGKVLRPYVHANWLHLLSGEKVEKTAAFTSGGAEFTAVGLRPNRDAYQVGTGVGTNFDEWSVNSSYDYQWRNDGYNAHQVTLRVARHF